MLIWTSYHCNEQLGESFNELVLTVGDFIGWYNERVLEWKINSILFCRFEENSDEVQMGILGEAHGKFFRKELNVHWTGIFGRYTSVFWSNQVKDEQSDAFKE